MNKFLNTLKNYWFLVLALVTLSAAWGQSQLKIQTLEDNIKQIIVITSEVSNLKAQSERIDERTKALQASQTRTERMIEMLLSNQKIQTSMIKKER